MRMRILPIVLWFLGLIILIELMIGLAHAGQANTGKSTIAPYVEAPPSQVLSDGERCTAESFQLKTTVLTLRAELARLQARVAELESPLIAQTLEKERSALEQKFRERLKPPTGSVFNWQTLTFVAPAAPK